MTLIDLEDHRQPAADEWESPEARKQAALATAAAHQAATGKPMSGAALARQYGMSERTGRTWVAELTATDRPSARAAATRPATARRPVNGTHTDRSPQPAPPAARPARPTGPRPPTGAGTEPAPSSEAGERWAWLDRAVTVVVAIVAAAASYGHMREVALLAGEPDWIAWLWPLTVDGLAIAALRKGDRGRWWLVVGLAVSVAANVGTNYPHVVEDVAWAIKAWPPLALLGTHCLLQRQANHGRAT